MLAIFSNLIEPQLYFSTPLSFAPEQPTCKNLVEWLAFKQKQKKPKRTLNHEWISPL
jgi:hypothetical protein